VVAVAVAVKLVLVLEELVVVALVPHQTTALQLEPLTLAVVAVEFVTQLAVLVVVVLLFFQSQQAQELPSVQT
jgi:hypothetical protein